MLIYLIKQIYNYDKGIKMAATPSTMIELGTKAPEFCLPDTVSGKTLCLNDLKSDKATVVMFICNHCPYVIHIIEKLSDISKDYNQKGISFIGISSNDVENYPDDSPDKMKEFAAKYGNPFPYLYDESQDVARAYKAACTPDLFIFDSDLKCVYRGQFDSSRPKNELPVTGEDLINALNAILEGSKPSENQIPSIGCNIKWKPGSNG